MSAAIAPRPTTTRRGAPDRTTTRRGHLRVVEAPARPALAPTGPLQAWRRRIGALAVLLAAIVLVGQAVAGSGAGEATSVDEVVPVSSSTVVVQPGQTLWDVASERAPAGVAPRAYLDELREVNALDGSDLDAWQVLRLPATG